MNELNKTKKISVNKNSAFGYQKKNKQPARTVENNHAEDQTADVRFWSR